MKKKLTLVLALLICVSAAFCLSSCDYKFGHNYYEDYSYDENDHWFDCTGTGCDARKDVEAHDLVDGYAVADGVTYVGKICTVCEYTRVTTEIVVALDEASFKDAVAEGGEIELGDDIVLSEALEIADGVEVKLDLNGKNITVEGDGIVNNGTLTLEGDGSITATDNGIENTGDLIINGGNVSGLGGISTKGGTVTVNNGNFTGASNWSTGTYNHVLYAENTAVTINGGNFDATVGGTNNAMIGIGENAVVTINDGNFKNVEGAIPNFPPYLVTYNSGSGKLIINGGTFYGGWRFNNTATTEIYGGNFTIKLDGQSQFGDGKHNLKIYGGTFNFDVSQHAVSGYSALDNGNGTWTVKLVPVADTGELSSSLQSGVSNVAIPEGTYTIPENFTSDTLTVVGAGEETEINTKTTGQYLSYHGKDITFTNLTIKGQSSGQYNGFAHVSDLVFEDCVIDGTLTLYGDSATFINCTFNLPAGCYIWTWGVGEATFDGCTFNTAGKAILMYGEKVDTVLTVKNCTFNATKGDKAGAITNQNCAAIEIDSSLINKGLSGEARVNRYTLITENNKYSDNFSGEWRIKGADEFDITVNGSQYGVLTLDGVKYEYVAGTKDVQLKDE